MSCDKGGKPKTEEHKSKIRESLLVRKARERELANVGDVLGEAAPERTAERQ